MKIPRMKNQFQSGFGDDTIFCTYSSVNNRQIKGYLRTKLGQDLKSGDCETLITIGGGITRHKIPLLNVLNLVLYLRTNQA